MRRKCKQLLGLTSVLIITISVFLMVISSIDISQVAKNIKPQLMPYITKVEKLIMHYSGSSDSSCLNKHDKQIHGDEVKHNNKNTTSSSLTSDATTFAHQQEKRENVTTTTAVMNSQDKGQSKTRQLQRADRAIAKQKKHNVMGVTSGSSKPLRLLPVPKKLKHIAQLIKEDAHAKHTNYYYQRHSHARNPIKQQQVATSQFHKTDILNAIQAMDRGDMPRFHTSVVFENPTGGQNNTLWGSSLIALDRDAQHIDFLDIQAEYNGLTNVNDRHSYIMSMGAGRRFVANHDNVIGQYLFVDQATSALKNKYWLLSPGMDFSTPEWTWAINAYVPMGANHHQETGFAQDFGYDQYWKAHYINSQDGSTITDRRMILNESMAYGGDLSLSYHPAHQRFSTKVGAYYYQRPKRALHLNQIEGAKVQVFYHVDQRLKLSLSDRYDNRDHNRVILGASMDLDGGNSTDVDNDESVSARLTATIYRNLNVNDTSHGVGASVYKKLGVEAEYANHVYFVSNRSNGGGTGAGSQNDPYTSLVHALSTSDNGQGNNADAHFWVEGQTGATYVYHDTGSDSHQIDLMGNQSISGRSSNFMSPIRVNLANIQDSPLVQARDGIDLDGNNTLSGFRLVGAGDNSNQSGVLVDANARGYINYLQIGSADKSKSFDTGIRATDGGQAFVNNTDVTINTDSTTGDSNQGLYLTGDGSSINFSNGKVSIFANGSLDPTGVTLAGDNESVTLTNSVINVSALAGLNNSSEVILKAVSMLGENGRVNIENSQINLNAVAGLSEISAYGFEIDDGRLLVDNSRVNLNFQSTDPDNDEPVVYVATVADGATANFYNTGFSVVSALNNAYLLDPDFEGSTNLSSLHTTVPQQNISAYTNVAGQAFLD